jgi:hypothetical protein
MAYSLIPLFLVVGLGVPYVALTEAPALAKITVAALVGLSLILLFGFPHLLLVATLIQVGVSVYIVVYLKIHGYGF